MKWFGIRKAAIQKDHRDLFERFGAPLVGTVLYGGFSGPATTEPQKTLYGNSEARKPAEEWLTEQYDRAERRETWLITMEAAVTAFVAAELLLSALALWRRPVQPMAAGRAAEVATAAASNRWQRMRECSEEADRMAKKGWAYDTAAGYVIENRISHYSEKYERCYVEVFFSTGRREFPDAPFTYSVIYDAFEGARVSSCVGPSDEADHSPGLPVTWCDGDCAVCRSHEKDRMNN
ncbi:MAG: hypothetical protein ABSH00_14950 [Bryobacteraceae bacterium]|jgi:hypothetical protein